MESVGTARSQQVSENGARTAVITGASAGIGRACVRAFAARGYDVALLARGRSGLDNARREVVRAGRRALVIPTDVADADGVFAAADKIMQEWGRIDVWVNNAMATVFAPADDIPAAEFRRVTEVTYLGAVHGTLAALRHMRPRNRGTIVQVGSALSYRSVPLQAPYCAAKFALRGFTDSLRCELIHQRSAIKLTMVQLPGVNTPQFDWSRTHLPNRHRPLGAVYDPEAVAAVIVEAAERTPREVWVGGSAMLTIASAMLAPGWGDRRSAATAYEQQMDADVVYDGEDILFAPAARDHGSQGRFVEESRARVLQVDPLKLRLAAAAAACVALAGAFFIGARRSSGTRRRLSSAEKTMR